MWWRCPLTVILSRCEASKLSLPIFMSWPIGSSNAGLRQSPWNRRGSTGSPFMRSSRSAGLPGSVVNARHVKNVPGRTKTDVLDCQWIQKLHSFGLLNGSFRPDQQIRTLRSLMRLRDNLVVQSTQSVHHMQKALFEMNVQLSNVISDIVGESGMRIVEAILAGERDPAVLAALCSTRIKASHDKPSLRACTATGARSCFSPSRGTGVLPLRPKQNRRVRYGHYRAPRTI
jgi:Transposase